MPRATDRRRQPADAQRPSAPRRSVRSSSRAPAPRRSTRLDGVQAPAPVPAAEERALAQEFLGLLKAAAVREEQTGSQRRRAETEHRGQLRRLRRADRLRADIAYFESVTCDYEDVHDPLIAESKRILLRSILEEKRAALDRLE